MMAGRYTPSLMRTILLICVPLLLTSCSRPTPQSSERQRVRVLITGAYRDQIKELMASGVRNFSVAFEDVEWVDMPGYAGRDAVFAPSLAARFADSEPDADIYFIDLYRVGSFRPSWLAPFDDVKGFRPAFLAAARFNDEVYAIPWSAKGNFLFYRKDLVPEPPKTWDAMRKACEALSEKGLPRGIRYCMLVNWSSIENDLYPALWSLGEPQRPRLDSDSVVNFVERIGQWFGEELASGFSMLPAAKQLESMGRIHPRFARGEAVFMINWNNRYRFMSDEQQKAGRTLPSVGIAPIPAAKEGGTRSSNIGTWGWIVPRLSASASAGAKTRHGQAKALVQELSSSEAVAWFVQRHGILPARDGIALPADMEPVLDRSIIDAMSGKPGDFVFRDRGSDALEHGFVRDALKDALLCAGAVTQPSLVNVGGDCVRYFDECDRSMGPDANCLNVAIKRRLKAAERAVVDSRLEAAP